MTAGAPLPGTPVPERFFRGVGGLRLAADSWGNPGGPLVVLQHGGGQTRHAWKGTGKALGAAGFHAVAFDARGHGDSGWAADRNYEHDIMVRDLQCVLQELGARRPILIGASMGGVTSLMAVGEGHVDAQALVLVDTAPKVETEGVNKIRAFMDRDPDGFESLEQVADAIASYQPHRERPKNLQGLAKNVRQAANGRYYWHWDPSFGLRNRDPAERRARLQAAAKNLTIPTLLVRGGQSDVLTDDGVRDFLQLVPGSEFVSIASAGHMVAGDRNDSFGEAAIKFLQRVVPAGGGASA